MKKSLIALAALAATGAYAQSSATIFGLLDQAYNQVDSSGTVKQKATTVGASANSGNGSGNLNGSRLGFRGTEDLGGGLKAGFLIEYGVNLTGPGPDAASTFAQNNAGPGLGNLRQGNVSLSSPSLGTVLAGTMYLFHDGASGAQGGSQAHGGTNNTYGAANLFKFGVTGGSPRATNAVAYISPAFNGLTVRLANSEGEQITPTTSSGGVTTKNNRATSFALDYVNGPIKAGVVQSNYSDVVLASTTLADVLGTLNDSAAIAASTGRNKITHTVFGGSYKFDFATLGYNNANFKQENVAATGSGVTGTVIESKQDSVSASIPVTSAFTVNAAYTTGKITNAGAKAYDSTGVDLIGVYALSKRTNVYGLYTTVKFENAVGGGNDTQQNHIAVGVRHSF